MIKVDVDLGERSYPIHIGPDLLDSTFAQEQVRGKQAAIITNTTIAPLYLDRLVKSLGNLKVDVFELPDGEA